MNRAIVGVCVGLLCGCVAKNPVLTKAEWDALRPSQRKGGGAIFALPQTRIEFAHVVVQKDFKVGSHTDVVDACQVNAAFASKQSVCKELLAVGIEKSARLSDKDARYLSTRMCQSDGGKAERRIEPAADPVWAFGSVPDPTETYIVPLRRGYFQTFDFTLELSNGTISKGSLSTDNLGAQDILGAVAQLARAYSGRGVATEGGEGATEATARLDERVVFPPLSAPNPSPTAVRAAQQDLEALRKLQRTRAVLVAEEADESLASRGAILVALNAQIARALEQFKGTVKTRPIVEERRDWIPSYAEQVAPLAGSTLAQSAEGSKPSFDACGDTNKLRPRWLSLVVAERDEIAGIAPVSSGSFSAAELSGRGWPYRVPQERHVLFTECASYAEETEPNKPPKSKWRDLSKATCGAHDGKRLSLPQFGKTFRLPEKTGGRKSVIAPDYAPDGSLAKVVVSHVGESPTPLVNLGRDLLMPQPKGAQPSETAVLTSEAELIRARQALCRLVHGVSETHATCLGPNPPTELPSDD